ncbi:hypothetical protein HDC92_002208 [Pedobacter sp. AK017]|uniref:hypothetical protein n=1 Tax=Pedobacter sp. AK017 TaxID=2723073 RepID=UPI0016221DC6|nr:hypothetical protein [Pedobacter sp. AK017]MBB5438532.1 hypothetical protein [Pedobacter sp. AK017]
MRTLKLYQEIKAAGVLEEMAQDSRMNYRPYVLLGALLLTWPLLQHWLIAGNPANGFVDASIWLLILLSLICFMTITGLCWWLLHRFWMCLGLPVLDNMVVQFKKMESWQQLGFYWASFGLLLLAAVGVLAAVL